MVRLIICSAKNLGEAGQWRVGGDKEQEEKRLENNPVICLSSNAQYQGGVSMTEADFCPRDPR